MHLLPSVIEWFSNDRLSKIIMLPFWSLPLLVFSLALRNGK